MDQERLTMGGVADQLATIAAQLERDRREPDKVLCYVQSLRRLVTDLREDARPQGEYRDES